MFSTGLGVREKFIVEVALSYPQSNIDDANEAFTAPCCYCGGECPSLEAEGDSAFCDGYAGDPDGFYADSETVEISCNGKVHEKIRSEEVEHLRLLYE